MIIAAQLLSSLAIIITVLTARTTQFFGIAKFGFLAGFVFYVVMPIAASFFIDYSQLGFDYLGLINDSEIQIKITLATILFAIFFISGFFISERRTKKNNGISELRSNFGINFKKIIWLICLFYYIFYILTEFQGGVYFGGERGGRDNILLALLITNSGLMVSATLADSVKSKFNKIIIIIPIFIFYLINSIFIDGSRRHFSLSFIFILLPYLLYMRMIRKIHAIILMLFIIAATIFFGFSRKFDASDESYSEIIFDFVRNPNSLKLVLLNSDSFMVFDAFIGVVSKAGNTIDYLWMESYLKFVYIFIPRILWSAKPPGISVRVADRIYGLDSSLISINPNLLGEAYFNGGLIGVAVVAFITGVLFSKIIKVKNSGYQTQDLFFSGALGLNLFNLWRGYTFETMVSIAVLFLFANLFYSKNHLNNCSYQK
jgi:oligosaccharide repeat unit polymerase